MLALNAEQLMRYIYRFLQAQDERDGGSDDDNRWRHSCAVTAYDAKMTSEW